VAFKFLAKIKPIAYARFRDEVAVLKKTNDIEGILPILDSYLPTSLSGKRPWYATPLAIPIAEWSQKASAREHVVAIAEAAETIADLHERGIAHRDLKPPNLVQFKDRCHVVDFGLVDYPTKSTLTGSKERIGPLWTMAPEVRRNGNKADPMPGDVFSLAKSLWINLKQTPQGFDGQYTAGGEVSIGQLFGDSYVMPLEELLSAATAHDPSKRPSMREFANGLRAWLDVGNDFLKSNPLQWRDALSKLFPQGAPARAVWEDPAQIVVVLNLLGQTNSLNHMFYPSGGGNDLEAACLSNCELGCIELQTGHSQIVRPISLTLETFPGDPQWNYFRLETGALGPSQAYRRRAKSKEIEEYVTEVRPGIYAPSSCWDEGRYDGKPLPKTARPVIRWFAGAFVIFQKTSFYNLAGGKLDAYDGRHNEMNAVEFRSHVGEMRKQVLSLGIDLRSRRLAERDAMRRHYSEAK
jgi:serine/threonine-protein kinase